MSSNLGYFGRHFSLAIWEIGSERIRDVNGHKFHLMVATDKA